MGEEVWECTTCLSCVRRCPKGVLPADAFIGLRSHLVEEGRIPLNVAEALKSVYVRGNPWRTAQEQRFQWAEGLQLKRISEGAEWLLFVCCVGAFDFRVQKATRALVELLGRAGVDFGVLGEEELCCGSEVKRVGDVWSFEELRNQNRELFNRYGVTRIVTLSPHCFNAFRHDYGLEAEHYSTLLLRLLESGALELSRRLEGRAIYHDPCFLGKQNGVFEEPREVVRRTGMELLEFDRNREASLCCEGGGGRMWVEVAGEEASERLAWMRMREAADKGADVVVTCCPFCLINLEDALKGMGLEERMEVLDLGELVARAL